MAKLFIYERKERYIMQLKVGKKILRWFHMIKYCKICSLINEISEKPMICSVCSEKEDLWLCMICGYLGCGRYKTAHAQKHFKETKHAFSLEVATQRQVYLFLQN